MIPENITGRFYVVAGFENKFNGEAKYTSPKVFFNRSKITDTPEVVTVRGKYQSLVFF